MPRHIIATVKLNKDAFQSVSVKYWGSTQSTPSTKSLSQVEQVLISVSLHFSSATCRAQRDFLFRCFIKKHKRAQRRKAEIVCRDRCRRKGQKL